jgi:hypothetical protein
MNLVPHGGLTMIFPVADDEDRDLAPNSVTAVRKEIRPHRVSAGGVIWRQQDGERLQFPSSHQPGGVLRNVGHTLIHRLELWRSSLGTWIPPRSVAGEIPKQRHANRSPPASSARCTNSPELTHDERSSTELIPLRVAGEPNHSFGGVDRNYRRVQEGTGRDLRTRE